VHHIVPRSNGGITELSNLLCLCSFHHLIAVHTWGWAVHLNGDGTVTAAHPTGRSLHDSRSQNARSHATRPHEGPRQSTGPPGKAA